jgi:hypothetical protein
MTEDSAAQRSSWFESMSTSQASYLAHYFFNGIHLRFPIIQKRNALEVGINNCVEQDGFGDDPAFTCLCLLVFALGTFAGFHRGDSGWGHEGMDDVFSPAGVGFFNEARRHFAFLPKGQLETAQCHILAR